jgi:hypothetical protein
MLLVVASFFASSAAASLSWLGEGQGEFPNLSSEIQLATSSNGLAVNRTTGDLYAADSGNQRVVRFDATGRLLEAWGWGVGDGAERFERCGPDGEQSAGKPLFPICLGRNGKGEGLAGEADDQLKEPEAVAVDQATGDIFVVSDSATGTIKEFSAEGQFIRAFGSRGSEVEQHSVFAAGPGGIAVDAEGRVYVMDGAGPHAPRVMVFEADAGGEYKYSKEIFSKLFEFEEGYLSISDGGSFFLRGPGHLYRFDSATATTPAWEHEVGEVSAITINPTTEEVYYYVGKENMVHAIKPQGKSEGTEQAFKGAVNQTPTAGAAFNPVESLGGRAPGVLYLDDVGSNGGHGLIFAGPVEDKAPLVGEESVTTRSTTFAALEGVVDPNGVETSYEFEYGAEGPCSVAPCAKAPIGGASAGNGEVNANVSVNVSGLKAGATYFYRLVASSHCHLAAPEELCVAHGADQSFKTFAALTGALPDGRAYELVTPIEKGGGEVFPILSTTGSCKQCEPGENATRMPEQSAPDGESVVYEGSPFFSRPQGGVGAVSENEYRSVRTPLGWQTTDLSPELGSNGSGSGFRAFATDLRSALFAQAAPPLTQGAPSDVNNFLYLQDASGSFTPLTTEVEPGLELIYAGATNAFSSVVFAANGALTPEAPVPADKGTERDLYEWSVGGGVRLVSVLPDGTSKSGATLGSGKLLDASPEAGSDHSNAVSSDGTRIFWSSEATGQVYVRENGTTTVAIPDNAKFVTASTDGTRVLLNDGHIHSLSDGASIDLTQGQGGFEGILGASGDLSDIYFVDTAALTNDNGPEESSAVSGAYNLYYYDGATSTLHFVTTLDPKDADSDNSVIGDWKPSPSDRLAQVTPDGRYLAFESEGTLIPGQPVHSLNGQCAEDKCSEVYEYDSIANSLTCVSCSGLPPVGPSYLSLVQPVDGGPGSAGFPPPQDLTDDGRLFFDSQDTLSAADTRPGVENVYEFEHAGQGSCTEPSGCVELLTSGSSTQDAAFFDASESGRDVFVTTRSRLLPAEDQDELVDLYDIREGGGFARTEPPAPCSAEACRPQTAGEQSFSGIPTVAFAGPGNLTSPVPAGASQLHATAKKCPKGKVLRHNKCVKKHRKKKSRRKGKKAHKTTTRAGTGRDHRR